MPRYVFIITFITFTYSPYLFDVVPCHSYPLYVSSVDSTDESWLFESRLDHFFQTIVEDFVKVSKFSANTLSDCLLDDLNSVPNMSLTFSLVITCRLTLQPTNPLTERQLRSFSHADKATEA
jgi:hypothetical protein